MDVPHVHRAIGPRQSLHHRPLDHAIAETEWPLSLGHAWAAVDLLGNAARKCLENASKRWEWF